MLLSSQSVVGKSRLDIWKKSQVLAVLQSAYCISHKGTVLETLSEYGVLIGKHSSLFRHKDLFVFAKAIPHNTEFRPVHT